MKDVLIFLKSFYRNHGMFVFLSFLIQKVSAFATTLIIIRLLTKEEFGLLSIVPAVFVMFAPFNGRGLPVGLLRYGTLLNSKEEKQFFANQILKQSVVFQFFLSVIFLITSIFFVDKYESILIIFIAFSIRLFGQVFLAHIQSYFRIQFNNKKFALVTIYNSVISLLLVILATYFYGFNGYLVAVTIAPFFVLFWYKKEMFSNVNSIFSFNKKEFNQFSWHAAINNFSIELLFAIDILILSFLLNEESVASYKVAILIPANMIFLAQSFIQSDYPKITLNNNDHRYLKNYILNYFKFFIPVCLLIISLGYIFREEIIILFFGKDYLSVSSYFTIFLFAFSANMIFRVLFGNLLSAIGKMNLVTYSTTISVVVLIISSMLLVPKLQIMGMVYSMFLALIFCGSCMYFFFIKELKKLKTN